MAAFPAHVGDEATWSTLDSSSPAPWSRHPYNVALSKSFASYREALIHSLAYAYADEGDIDGTKFNAAKARAEALLSVNEQGLGEHQYSITNVSDSSIFGNDVINPYAGFCRDDDIVHQMFRAKNAKNDHNTGNYHAYGMGRVYAEIFDIPQQVAYFQFGLPKYRNLSTYLKNAYDPDMGELQDSGSKSLISKLAGFIKGGVKLAITLPVLPLEWAGRLIEGMTETKVTEYFYFKETMMLYYKNVNTILSHIAVGLGIYWGENDANLPQIFKGGPDIFKILSTRSRRFNAVATSGSSIPNADMSTDDMIKSPSSSKDDAEDDGQTVWEEVKDGWHNFWDGFSTSALDGNKFIAFRIEKGSDNASETFSNTVGPSSLEQRLNGMVKEHRDNTLAADTAGNDLLSWGQRTFKQVSSFIGKAKDLFTSPTEGVPNIISYMAAGNGYFDLPQQWNGSNFSRSVNINLRLRSKTGADPVSIYTSIMIPLACCLAGAMPRQTGDGTYTSPFICRCWCRGMFSIPAGIIQSLTISRGDSEFGWSRSRLPTTVSVNMQIADLSPIIFLGMADENKSWQQAFANNTKLIEYLGTLTGLGLKQRYYFFQQLKRQWKTFWLINKNTNLSATYLGQKFGETFVGKVVGAFSPVSAMRVSNN